MAEKKSTDRRCRIPDLKSSISSYLMSEEGKISKKSLLKMGSLAGSVVLASSISSAIASADCTSHTNSLKMEGNVNEGIKAGHTHHGSHSNSSASASASSSSGGGCFSEDTLIATKDGDKPIKGISVGDSVLTYNLETRSIEYGTVEEVVTPLREGIYVINDGIIRVTGSHPFYIYKKDGKEGWGAIEVEAAIKENPSIPGMLKLEAGDSMLSKEGKRVEVSSIDYVEGNIQTYNLKRVDRNSNFFANHLLVHNKCGL